MTARNLAVEIATYGAFRGKRDYRGAIGKALQQVAGEVPYVIRFDHERALFLVRVFATKPPPTLSENVFRALEEWTPAHLALSIVYEPPPFDLRAFVQAVANREPGALEVLVDAAIELRVVDPEVHGAGLVGHVVLWAEEVFPSVRAPNNNLR